MLDLKSSASRILKERIFSDDREKDESDIAEYLFEREEIALKSLQDSLKSLKRYQAESIPSQN